MCLMHTYFSGPVENLPPPSLRRAQPNDTLTLDSWPPELWENTPLLLETPSGRAALPWHQDTNTLPRPSEGAHL